MKSKTPSLAVKADANEKSAEPADALKPNHSGLSDSRDDESKGTGRDSFLSVPGLALAISLAI
jgi:hypothetical protein